MLTVKGGSLETLKTVNVWASQITSLAVLRKCSSLEVCKYANTPDPPTRPPARH